MLAELVVVVTLNGLKFHHKHTIPSHDTIDEAHAVCSRSSELLESPFTKLLGSPFTKLLGSPFTAY